MYDLIEVPTSSVWESCAFYQTGLLCSFSTDIFVSAPARTVTNAASSHTYDESYPPHEDEPFNTRRKLSRYTLCRGSCIGGHHVLLLEGQTRSRDISKLMEAKKTIPMFAGYIDEDMAKS